MARNSGVAIDSLQHALDQVTAQLRQALMAGGRTGALRREQAEAQARLDEARRAEAEIAEAVVAEEAGREAAQLERATDEVLSRIAIARERRLAGVHMPATPRLHLSK